MKLLLDEMWPPEIAAQLRRRGHDVVAVVERPDLRSQPDRVIFATAQQEGRAVVTENVADFRPLGAAALQQDRSHAGLILTSNGRFPRHEPRTSGRLVTALDALLLQKLEMEDLEYWLS